MSNKNEVQEQKLIMLIKDMESYWKEDMDPHMRSFNKYLPKVTFLYCPTTIADLFQDILNYSIACKLLPDMQNNNEGMLKMDALNRTLISAIDIRDGILTYITRKAALIMTDEITPIISKLNSKLLTISELVNDDKASSYLLDPTDITTITLQEYISNFGNIANEYTNQGGTIAPDTKEVIENLIMDLCNTIGLPAEV